MKNSNAVRECQHIRRPAAISTVSQSVPRMWKVWHCWSWNGNSVKIHLNSHRFLTGCTNTPPGSANTTCPWVWCDQSANGRVWPHPNSRHLVSASTDCIQLRRWQLVYTDGRKTRGITDKSRNSVIGIVGTLWAGQLRHRHSILGRGKNIPPLNRV